MDEIKVIIKFYSTLSNLVEKSEEEISFVFSKGSTLVQILEKVEEKFFIPKKYKLLELSKNNEYKLESGIICLIDEADYTLSGGLDQKIENNIKLTLLSSLHGG